jgi:hypothetical protein
LTELQIVDGAGTSVEWISVKEEGEGIYAIDLKKGLVMDGVT